MDEEVIFHDVMAEGFHQLLDGLSLGFPIEEEAEQVEALFSPVAIPR